MIHFPKLNDDKKQTSPILTRDIILETFGISKTTLQRWTKEYGLPYHKVNRRVFFKTEEFNEWFSSYKVQQKS